MPYFKTASSSTEQQQKDPPSPLVSCALIQTLQSSWRKEFDNPDLRNSFTKSVVSWSDGSLEVMLWNAHTIDFTSFFFGFLLTFFAAHFHFELSFLQTNNFQNKCVTKTLSLDPARRLEVQVELHMIFQTLLQCLRIVAGRDSSKHYLREKKNQNCMGVQRHENSSSSSNKKLVPEKTLLTGTDGALGFDAGVDNSLSFLLSLLLFAPLPLLSVIHFGSLFLWLIICKKNSTNVPNLSSANVSNPFHILLQ